MNATATASRDLKNKEDVAKITEADAPAAIRTNIKTEHRCAVDKEEFGLSNGGAEEDTPEDQFATATPSSQKLRIEEFVRFSESHLWKLMESFYDRNGVSSWSKNIVPHFITSNAFIGRAYARILSGFLADLSRSQSSMNSKMGLNRHEKFYIVEVGAGSGKFAFFMLNALEEMSDILEFPLENVVYVMSDFTKSNFKFWMNHPALKKYVRSGRLDFALFDAANDHEITLHNTGVVLRKDQPTSNPLCIVCNYLFDTLPHDLFQVDDGSLKEQLISVGSARLEEPDVFDPEILNRLCNEYKAKKSDTNYYSNKEDPLDELHLSRILTWYKEFFTNNDPAELGASILIPIGAIRAIRRLTDLSNGKAIIISGDKGSNSPEHFRGLVEPHIALHGSFSLMVNMHAIGMYVTSRGGFALHQEQEESSLQVSCFVLESNHLPNDISANCFHGDIIKRLDKERAANFPMLKKAFVDNIENFGPNDFFVMQKCLQEEARPSLRSIVSLLKLSDWDADIFFKNRDLIVRQISSATYKLKGDLCRGIEQVWENYYMLDKDKDIAFEIGRFYYGVRQYADALTYYEVSTESFGPHHVTYHNMGLCQYSLGNIVAACACFRKSLKFDPCYKKASSWLDKVTSEMLLLSGEESNRDIRLL